ncbi:MAG: glycosyltransferase family 1 protein [Acidobacteria bacterium]|nr:glycosyltransferase family 1 protein [Acidobacteriota bacterium]
MRVVVFTDNDFDKVNGVTTTWRAVLRAAEASRTVRIFTASDGEADLPDYFAAASFGIGLPWYRDMRVYLPRLRRFARQLRQDGATVVHVATPGPVGLAGRWLARRAGLPLVGSYHTHLGDYVGQFSRSPRLGRSFDAYMRWFYAPCASLLVPSQATVDQLRAQGYRPSQMQIWPRGVDIERFSPERRSPDLRRAWHVDGRQPAILYAGRLSSEKGLAIVEDVQRRLHRHAVAHRFIFAGDGPMRPQLERLVPDAVFLGSLRHADMATVMASADVLLFPSATDTFGNVVLEAQASGLPVVVSDRGGPCQQITPHVTGEVCAAGDAEAFAVAVARLLRDAGRRAAMALAARQHIMGRTWEVAMRPLFGAWETAHAASASRSVVPEAPTAPASARRVS